MKGGSCKKKYALVEKVPDINDILDLILPKVLFGEDTDGVIEQLQHIISQITPQSTTGQIVDKMAQVSASVLGSIVSYGMGGDVIVNMIYTIRNGIALTLGIISVIRNELIRIKQQLQDPEILRMIYNLLDINFTEGIEGVRCKVKYIFSENKRISVNMLLCELFRRVYPKMAEFIGSLMSASIPNSGGLPQILIVRAMKTNAGKNYMMSMVIKKLKKFYKKVPKKYRKMLEDPNKLENYLSRILSKGAFIYGAKIQKQVIKYIKGIAYILHKMIAITFMLLYVFKECPTKAKRK